MKAKRILSVFLSLLLVLGTVFVPAFAEDTATITAYITVSRHGEILTDTTGAPIAAAPITLTGKASYTLDDAFIAAHDAYFDGGAASGYASAVGNLGLSVVTFWNDSSGQVGYQVNQGTESVMGLSHEISDGDYIDAYLTKTAYPDTEAYSTFDKNTAEVRFGEEVALTLTEASYDANGNTVFSPCIGAALTIDGTETEVITDENGKATLTFDIPGRYVVSAVKSKQLNDQTVPAITAPVCVVTVGPDACITVPNDATLFVGQKSGAHYVAFTEIPAATSVENTEDGTTSYYFDMTDKSFYNLRVSGENYITYATYFQKTADFALSISDAELKPEGKTKTTVDRDTASNSGYNVANIYLNINPQGHLTLANIGDTYQLVPLRNWETIESISNAFFAQPDFHYTILDENGETSEVVSIDEKGLLSANSEGTAIVLVTYDAFSVASAMGGPFFGAIWPENTGVFVVSVGSAASGIESGMTIHAGKNDATLKLSGDAIDAEHDVIYFLGESGSYTFTPVTEGCTVSVANPTVDTAMTFTGFETVSFNEDGSFTVPLTEGRNIVKLEKDGKAIYQVITAKQVSITINNGESVHPGDTVSVVFDTLYHPANKLSGVYNMNALPVYTNVSGYEEKLIGGLPAQYNFASSQNAQTVSNVLKERNFFGSISYQKDTDLTVPADYAYDTFTLSGGMLLATGFGDAYGNHRGITLTDGKAPNLNAAAKVGWMGSLPDIEIPITITDSVLNSITLDTTKVKKEYYAGEAFDPTNLIVTANYENGQTQIATNYTITPEVLTADTESVTITYREKTATVDVQVTVPKVTEIAVTSAPSKTTYTEGDVFDPTGMVVTATYEGGKTAVTTSYSYTPNRELQTTDTEMTITYTGEDATDTLAAATTPITVTAASQGGTGGTVSDNITVYFTLLGDEKHGTPSGDSDTHTQEKGNLDTWVSKTAVSVKRGSYVIDAIAKALSIAGIPYSNPDGNYISDIRGLGEFDNGAYSGWMYTLNGEYPELGIAEQTLSQGDSIVFHYTDDYSQESNAPVTDDDDDNNSSNNNSGYRPGGLISGNQTSTPASTTSTSSNTSTTVTYADVKASDWYYEAVTYVTKEGLMQGTGNGFEPETPMTRAMLVTVLYRMENEPTVSGAAAFGDVESGSWYENAVIWAQKNGIVNGVSESAFDPHGEITREQMAAIFYRYAKGSQTDADLSAFADSNSISPWAADAMDWAITIGLINGVSNTDLAPQGSANRAQVATILMRYLEN